VTWTEGDEKTGVASWGGSGRLSRLRKSCVNPPAGPELAAAAGAGAAGTAAGAAGAMALNSCVKEPAGAAGAGAGVDGTGISGADGAGIEGADTTGAGLHGAGGGGSGAAGRLLGWVANRAVKLDAVSGAWGGATGGLGVSGAWVGCAPIERMSWVKPSAAAEGSGAALAPGGEEPTTGTGGGGAGVRVASNIRRRASVSPWMPRSLG